MTVHDVEFSTCSTPTGTNITKMILIDDKQSILEVFATIEARLHYGKVSVGDTVFLVVEGLLPLMQ